MKKTTKQKGFIKIFQKGGNKNGHAIIEEAARFMGLELMSSRMLNGLQIRIELRARKAANAGHCSVKCNGSDATKKFTIELSRDDHTATQLEVLAHEMIHVQQIATGRLQKRLWKSDKQLHVRWEGKELGLHKNIPYKTMPWEIEAYAGQKALKTKYIDKDLSSSFVKSILAGIK